MIIPTSNKQWLKWTQRVLWESGTMWWTWKWQRDKVLRAHVVSKIVQDDCKDRITSYVRPSILNLTNNSQVEIFWNTNPLGNIGMVDQTTYWYKTFTAWVYRTWVDVQIQWAWLTQATIHILKNWTSIANDTIVQFTETWANIFRIVWESILTFDGWDVVTFFVSFSWATSVSVLWLDDKYASSFYLNKVS